ncbi:MAG: asparaginase, partial [Micropruina sp.]
MSLSEAPVVAQVYRNGFLESVHRGLVAVTRPEGSVSFHRGDPETPILPRSSAKPIQALAMVRCGLNLPPDQLALACASHSGESYHLETVRRILAEAGVDESALQNTPDYPLIDAYRFAWIAAGKPMSALAQNCSGKHAAMLATCQHNGWPLATYLTRGHPLQQAVAETIRSF